MTLLGVLCGLAIGAVIVMLFRSRRSEAGTLPEIEGGFDLGFDLPPPTSSQLRGIKSGQGPSMDTVARARTVPVARTATISHTEPSMLLQAVGRRNWTVDVRTVGPSGSFATFMISNNTGNSIIVPAGGHHRMRLPHGEFLYAQGEQPGTCVSVSGGED
jgi:hypothetical protein